MVDKQEGPLGTGGQGQSPSVGSPAPGAPSRLLPPLTVKSLQDGVRTSTPSPSSPNTLFCPCVEPSSSFLCPVSLLGCGGFPPSQPHRGHMHLSLIQWADRTGSPMQLSHSLDCPAQSMVLGNGFGSTGRTTAWWGDRGGSLV